MMKCDDVDRLVLFAIVLTVIGDGLALIAELLSQRCSRQEQVESENATEVLRAKLNELEQRISKLEKT